MDTTLTDPLANPPVEEAEPATQPPEDERDKRLKVLEEQYKNLQRQNQKLSKRAETTDETVGGLKRIESLLSGLAQTMGHVDLPDEAKAPLAQAIADTTKQELIQRFTARKRSELGEYMEAMGTEWESDPRFEKARGMWDSLRLDDAVNEVRKLFMENTVKKAPPVTAEDDFKARVEAEVQRRLKEARKMDTGVTTSPATPKFSLDAWRKMSREEREKPEVRKALADLGTSQ